MTVKVAMIATTIAKPYLRFATEGFDFLPGGGTAFRAAVEDRHRRADPRQRDRDGA